jgi:hypothetical protein
MALSAAILQNSTFLVQCSIFPPQAVSFSSAVSKNACINIRQLFVSLARIFWSETGNQIIKILLRQKILFYLFCFFLPSTLLPFFGCGRRPRWVTSWLKIRRWILGSPYSPSLLPPAAKNLSDKCHWSFVIRHW